LGSIDILLKKIRKTGTIDRQPDSLADRVPCMSTRTLRMSKTLCSVRKTIWKHTDRFVRSSWNWHSPIECAQNCSSRSPLYTVCHRTCV